MKTFTTKLAASLAVFGLMASVASANTITSKYSLVIGGANSSYKISNFTPENKKTGAGGNIALDISLFDWAKDSMNFGMDIGASSVKDGYLGYADAVINWNIYKGLVISGTAGAAGLGDTTSNTNYTGFMYGGKIGYDFTDHQGVNLTYKTGTLSDTTTAVVDLDVDIATLNYIYHF